jgi:hypothetical protein
MKDALFLVAGALISAWIGLATSRYLYFQEQRNAARRIVVRLGLVLEAMLKEADQHAAEARCAVLLADPALNLEGAGFRANAHLIYNLDMVLQRETLRHFAEFKRAIATKDGKLLEVTGEAFKVFVRDAGNAIDGMRPQTAVILFGDLAGRLDIKLRLRVRDLTRYLNGESEDWK